MQEQTRPVPPYVAYRTFRTFLEFLLEGIPDRIDRSVWGARFSGSSGTQLLTTLKVLRLVDDEGRPSPELERLVHAEGAERRRLLRMVLERFYAPVFRLDLTRATRGQFHEAFRSFGSKEAVLTKCEAFFIQAAQDAGIELSQYILARRHGTRRATPPSRERQRSSQPRAEAVTPLARMEAVAQPARPEAGASPRLAMAEMILAKYPDFDPAWAPEVQARWMEGLTKLYEGLSAPGRDGETQAAAV